RVIAQAMIASQTLGDGPAEARLTLVVRVASSAITEGALCGGDNVGGCRCIRLPAHQRVELPTGGLEQADLAQDGVDRSRPKSGNSCRNARTAHGETPGKAPSNPKATKQIKAATTAMDRPQASSRLNRRRRSSLAAAPATQRAPI